MRLLALAWNWLRSDPRHGQILTLGSLLFYGLGWLGFDLGPAQVALTLASALAVQRLGDAWTGAPWRSGAKSALISALSLCLLLRTDALWLAAVGSAIAVGSKFVIRVRGKHVFNPTNGALVALLLTTDLAWVSPGQWGTAAAFAFAMACAGMLVVNRAARSDVTLAFLASYAALLVGRSLSLGEPLTIPLHRLESGAFLLFSFFMISDPKTTPDSRVGRIAFAMLVAAGAWYVHFRLFRPNGFVWALAAASPLVPVIDWFVPAARYQWPQFVTRFSRLDWRTPMLRKTAVFLFVTALGLAVTARAEAFCGFYVAKADTSLFNKASQVVLVRDGDRTVITMANDFRGNPREFAMVIPVPTSITREQIHIAESALVEASRRLHRAAPGRVLRPRSLCGLRPAADDGDGGGGAGRGRSGAGRTRVPRASASPSRPPTRSANTTSSSSRRRRARVSRRGCARTAIASRPARPRCSAATSARRCASSSPR